MDDEGDQSMGGSTGVYTQTGASCSSARSCSDKSDRADGMAVWDLPDLKGPRGELLTRRGLQMGDCEPAV